MSNIKSNESDNMQLVGETKEAVHPVEEAARPAQKVDIISKGLISSHSFTHADDPFDAAKHFESYHHYEVFDDNKLYASHQNADYGHGNRPYTYSMYTVSVHKGEEVTVHDFVVATEELTEEERKTLAPFCQCDACCWPWFLIGMLLIIRICPCCIGCLGARNDPPQWNIDKARKYALTHPPREEIGYMRGIAGLIIGIAALAGIFIGAFIIVFSVIALCVFVFSTCAEYVKSLALFQ